MIFVALVPFLVALVGVAFVVALAHWWRSTHQNDRRSPLARDLMRPPGYSLRRKIADLDSDINLFIIVLFSIPLLVYSVHLSVSYFGRQPESVLRIAVSVSAGMLAEVLFGRKLLRLLNERKSYALGLDGELATAEELNQLMRDGCRVFHDIPFPYGNIDHVVISHSGVYTVNSKALGKPPGDGSAEVRVDYQKNIIHFPDRQYNIPVHQLTAEAKWLSDHLTKAVGQPVVAEPMLALPGWFIKERTGHGVCVVNPVKANRFFIQSRQVVSDEMAQRIGHQLEQLCRDVTPVFREKKEWASKKNSP